MKKKRRTFDSKERAKRKNEKKKLRAGSHFVNRRRVFDDTAAVPGGGKIKDIMRPEGYIFVG